MKPLLLLIQTAPAGFDFPLVAALTAFIALPVKVLVDVVKGALPAIPAPVLPIIGLALAYVFCLVVLVAASISLNGAVYAQCAIAAVDAQVAAMAATSFQSKVNKTEERVDAALEAKPGTSKVELDAKVFGTGAGK